MQTILRMCMAWYADSPSPRWLQTFVTRDPVLRACRDELEFLENKLRDAAPAWAKHHESHLAQVRHGVSNQPIRRWTRRAIPFGAGLAIVVLVTCHFMSLRRIQEAETIAMRPIRAEITAFVRVCSDTFAAKSVVQLPTELTPTPLFQSSSEQLRDAVRQPMDQIGKSYGRALAYLDHHVQRLGSVGLGPK